MKSHIKSIVFALAVATLCSLPIQARAGISGRWNFDIPVTSWEQAQGLKPGTKIAMTCIKCKTVQVAEVDKKKGFMAWFEPDKKHLCPGCGGSYQYSHRRVGFRGPYTHTCSKCGSKSMFCCSTHPGEKTKGM